MNAAIAELHLRIEARYLATRAGNPRTRAKWRGYLDRASRLLEAAVAGELAAAARTSPEIGPESVAAADVQTSARYGSGALQGRIIG